MSCVNKKAKRERGRRRKCRWRRMFVINALKYHQKRLSGWINKVIFPPHSIIRTEPTEADKFLNYENTKGRVDMFPRERGSQLWSSQIEFDRRATFDVCLIYVQYLTTQKSTYIRGRHICAWLPKQSFLSLGGATIIQLCIYRLHWQWGENTCCKLWCLREEATAAKKSSLFRLFTRNSLHFCVQRRLMSHRSTEKTCINRPEAASIMACNARWSTRVGLIEDFSCERSRESSLELIRVIPRMIGRETVFREVARVRGRRNLSGIGNWRWACDTADFEWMISVLHSAFLDSLCPCGCDNIWGVFQCLIGIENQLMRCAVFQTIKFHARFRCSASKMKNLSRISSN